MADDWGTGPGDMVMFRGCAKFAGAEVFLVMEGLAGTGGGFIPGGAGLFIDGGLFMGGGGRFGGRWLDMVGGWKYESSSLR